MDVIVLDDSEEEAQDSASTSFMEEVNRDLGNDPQHIIRAQVSLLTPLTYTLLLHLWILGPSPPLTRILTPPRH